MQLNKKTIFNNLKIAINLIVSFLLFFIFVNFVYAADPVDGTYLSWHDNGGPVNYGTITWTEDISAGMTVEMKVRTAENANMSDATAWASCIAVASGTDISSNDCVNDGDRYVEYYVNLHTDDGANVAKISDVTINLEGKTDSMISNVFDSEVTDNVINSLVWTEELLGASDIRFHLRSSANNSTWTSWMGPDGTISSYFTDPTGSETPHSSMTDGSGDRYVQYQAYFISDGTNKATLSDFNVQYDENDPIISSVSPDYTDISQSSVSLTIPGSDFVAGATVKLINGVLEYTATNVSVTSGQITCDFAISNEMVGVWDLEITNTNQGTDTLENAFTIYNISTYISWYDAGGPTDFTTINWTENIPSGASLVMRVRSADNSNMSDASAWASCDALTNGQDLSGNNCVTDGQRYVEYQAEFTLNNKNLIARVSDVEIGFEKIDELISTPYNSNDPANLLGLIEWTETLPANTEAKFQIRTAPNAGGLPGTWTDWCGPDDGVGGSCATTTYFTDPSGGESIDDIMSDGVDDQWMQYKLILFTSGSNVPIVSDVTMTYVVNAMPELRNVVASQDSDGVVNIAYEARDPDTTTGTFLSGHVIPTIEYWTGSAWVVCSSTDPGDTSSTTVDELAWSAKTAAWYPKDDFPNQYLDNLTGKIRVKISDNEAANHTATMESNTFTLDTTPPALGATSTIADAHVGPVQFTLDASDDSDFSVAIAQGIDNSSCLTALDSELYDPYDANYTKSFTRTDPVIFCARFRDQYNNTSTVSTIEVPEYPVDVMVQDTSNLLSDPNEFRLFVAWKVIDPLPLGFAQYNIYRSTDDENYSYIGSPIGGDINLNYYGDVPISSSTIYYYKVTAEDNNGNESFLSNSVNGRANGIQDVGEGGGGAEVSPPEISDIATSSVFTDQVTITWDTDELSDSIIGYSVGTNTFETVVGINTMANNEDTPEGIGKHSVTLANLTANTEYFFEVRSTDPYNNTGVDDNNGAGYMFRTLSGPTISNVTVSDIQNNSVVINWLTDNNSDTHVYVSTSSDMTNSVETAISELTQNHIITVSNLTQGTKYYFYVESGTAIDNNPVVDQDSGGFTVQYYTFTTLNDITAPVITFATSTDILDITETSARIQWETDELATSTLEFGTTTSYGTIERNNNYNMNHSFDIVGLDLGTRYYIRLLSTDQSGNVSLPTTAYFETIDTTDYDDPVITVVPDTDNITSTTARIYWTTDEQASSTVMYGTSTGAYTMSERNNGYFRNHSVNLTGLTFSTNYYYQVMSEDYNNNVATSAEYIFETAAEDGEVIDTEFPEFTVLPTADPVGDTFAIIKWTTDELSDSKVEYGESSGNYSLSLSNSSDTVVHSISLTTLTNNTKYYYRVISTDPSGNAATSSEYSFTTQETLLEQSEVDELVTEAEQSSGGGGIVVIDKTDRTAPDISIIDVQDIKTSSAIITWETNELSDSFVEYGTTTNYGDVHGQDRDNTKNHSVILKRLSPETTYNYRVTSLDTWANMSTSENLTFTTLSREELAEQKIEEEFDFEEVEALSNEELLEQATKKVIEIINSSAGEVSLAALENSLLDQFTSLEELAKLVPGPLLSGEPRVIVTANTASIAWNTDKEANSLVGLSSDADYDEESDKPYLQVIGNPDELVVDHVVSLYDLKPDTVYHYQVKSKGVLGDASVSRDFTFITLKEELGIANYNIEVIDTETANFKWITNIEADTSLRYTPYRNNILAVDETKIKENTAMSVLHEIEVDDFESGVTYMIELISKDFDGNTVTERIDVFSTSEEDLPPIIYQIQTKSALSPGKDIGVQTIISWMTNEPATTRLYYKEGIGGSEDELTEKTRLDTNYTKKHVAVLTNFKPGMVYRFRAESIDSGGNISQSKVYTVLTPRQSESVFQVIMKNFEDVFGWVKNVR